MYETIEIRTIQEVRDLFPNNIPGPDRWILASTGGIHGSRDKLDEIEYILRGEVEKVKPLNNNKWFITILVIEPERCILRWGEIQVNLEDISFLRKLIRASIEYIQSSQGGNI